MQIPRFGQQLQQQQLSSWVETIAEKLPSSEATISSTTTPNKAMGPLTRLTVLLAALWPSHARSDSPPSLPQIREISFSGNGCPQGSQPRYSGNFNDLEITYNNFAVRLPGNEANRACQVHIQAYGGTPGWQFALRDVLVTGHAFLQSGTSLDWMSTVYFSQDAARTVTPPAPPKTIWDWSLIGNC